MSAPYEHDDPPAFTPNGPPCVDCKGTCRVGSSLCTRCMSHGCTTGIEPCDGCGDESMVRDNDGEAVCFACAELRGVCPMVVRCVGVCSHQVVA